HARQGGVGQGIRDVLSRYRQRAGAVSAGVHGERTDFLGAVAQRGSHLRARLPDPPRLLMRRLSLFFVWLTLAAAAVPARAADDLSAFVGRPIASVDLEVLGKSAPDEVRSLVVLKKNTPLSLEDVRNSVRSLVVVGRFESVDVLASDGPNGVAI